MARMTCMIAYELEWASGDHDEYYFSFCVLYAKGLTSITVFVNSIDEGRKRVCSVSLKSGYFFEALSSFNSFQTETCKAA